MNQPADLVRYRDPQVAKRPEAVKGFWPNSCIKKPSEQEKKKSGPHIFRKRPYPSAVCRALCPRFRPIIGGLEGAQGASSSLEFQLDGLSRNGRMSAEATVLTHGDWIGLHR